MIKIVKEIAEIPYGPLNTLKVSVVPNGKKYYLDMRKWEKSEKYSGPTKQGIWLHPEILQNLIDNKILEKGLEEIDEQLSPKSE